MSWGYQPLVPASANLLAGAGTQALTPSLFSSATVAFFAATVAVGAVNVSPPLFSNANAFYAPTVTRGAVNLTPALSSNTNTFFAPTVTQPAASQDLTVGLVSNTESFYAATVASGAVDLTPELFGNTESFFDPTVTLAEAASAAETAPITYWDVTLGLQDKRKSKDEKDKLLKVKFLLLG